MTHREFSILSEENVERTHDMREQEAMYAIIYAAADRGKGKKGEMFTVPELYDRTKFGESSKEEDAKDALERHEEAKDWLKGFGINGIA